MNKIITIFISILFLVSCSSTQSYGDKIVALNVSSEDIHDLYSIEIPSATPGNFISHGLMLATSKAFSNPTSNLIKDMLNTKPNLRLAVIGDSQTNNFLNLQHALNGVKNHSNAVIYINANDEQVKKLQEIANPKGIKIRNGNIR